jgi:hypothetical protein
VVRRAIDGVAPLWGRVDPPLPSPAFESVRGSFEGRYNIRLHQTVPRARCVRAARGELPVIASVEGPCVRATLEYTSGFGAHENLSVLGAVHHGLSGRAAPLVSRNR